MADDAFKGYNPFATLKKTSFPDKRGKQNTPIKKEAVKKTVQSTHTDSVAVAGIANDVIPDEDMRLFLHAMSRVAKLDEANAKVHGKSRQKKEQTAHGMFTLGEFFFDKEYTDTEENDHLSDNQHATTATSFTVPQEPSFATLLAHSLSGTGEIRRLKKHKETIRARSREAQMRAESQARALEAAMNPTSEKLFLDAMSDVSPLHGKGREVIAEKPQPTTPRIEENNPLQEFMEGKVAFTLAATDEYVEAHVIGLDLAQVVKLQAGQFSPEAHIDLHGLNAPQAYESLIGFIRSAYMHGRRTVLVVCGRGKNSPSGVGVLRERVQEWFTQDPFKRVILAFCTAKPSDGGAGALYVLLRKWRKSKGKVYWDRKPTDSDLYL